MSTFDVMLSIPYYPSHVQAISCPIATSTITALTTTDLRPTSTAASSMVVTTTQSNDIAESSEKTQFTSPGPQTTSITTITLSNSSNSVSSESTEVSYTTRHSQGHDCHVCALAGASIDSNLHARTSSTATYGQAEATDIVLGGAVASLSSLPCATTGSYSRTSTLTFAPRPTSPGLATPNTPGSAPRGAVSPLIGFALLTSIAALTVIV